MEAHESFEAGLLKILLQIKAITQEDADALKKAFHDSDVDQFEDFLLAEDIIDQEHILEALSLYYQVPSFDVVGYFFERHLVRMFPKDMLLRNELIPIEVDENMMIMVTSRPNNPDLLFEIGENVSYDIRFFVGIGRDITDAVKEFYDKADTEESQDQDIHEEYLLLGEFQHIEEEDDKDILYFAHEEEDGE
jgi:Type II secretion system (T2SS), protein E, N-terminal domain